MATYKAKLPADAVSVHVFAAAVAVRRMFNRAFVTAVRAQDLAFYDAGYCLDATEWV